MSLAFNLPAYDETEWNKTAFLDSETKVKKYKAAYQITDAYIQRVLGGGHDCYAKGTIEEIVKRASKEREKLGSGEGFKFQVSGRRFQVSG